MTKFCFQYLAIYSNENLPKTIQIVKKWVENFAQNQIYPKCVPQDFLNIGQSGEITPNLVTLIGSLTTTFHRHIMYYSHFVLDNASTVSSCKNVVHNQCDQ